MGRQWCQEESCISLLVCLGTAYLLRWIMDHRRSFPDLEKEQNYNETTQDSEMEMGCKISSDGSIFVKRYEVVIVERKLTFYQISVIAVVDISIGRSWFESGQVVGRSWSTQDCIGNKLRTKAKGLRVILIGCARSLVQK